MAYPSSGKKFPGFDRVYYVDEPNSSEFRVDIDLTLETALAALRGECVPTAPVSGRWVMGRTAAKEFVWTTLGIPFIISARAISILSEHGFVGWGTYPVNLFGPGGEPIADYHGLVVSGRCGPRQPDRSIAIQRPGPIGKPTLVYKGLFFDEGEWDGSDLFMPRDTTGFVFVVEQVREVLQAARVTGVSLKRVDSNERPFP